MAEEGSTPQAPGPAGPRLVVAWEAAGDFHPHTLGVSADGGRAVAGLPGTIAVWDARAGVALGRFTGAAGGLDHLALSGDGSAVASWGGMGSKRPTLWTAGTKGMRAKRPNLQLGSEVEEVAFHPDGRRALAADIGGTLTLFERASGDVHRTWPSGRYAPRIVRFAPERNGVLVAKNDQLTEWDLETAQARRTLGLGLGNGNNTLVALHPDGRHVAIATRHAERSACVVVDTDAFAVAHRIEPRPEVRGVQFDPSGTRVLLSVERGEVLETWASDGSEQVSTFRAVTTDEWRDLDMRLYGELQPLPDGVHLAAVIQTQGVHAVVVFAQPSRERVLEWRPAGEAGPYSPVTKLAVGAGGHVFAAATAGTSDRCFFGFLAWAQIEQCT